MSVISNQPVLSVVMCCSLVLMSACNERVSFLAPKFQMGPNNAQALVVTPDGEVHQSGQLTVSIRGFLDTLTKKRRLLATLADVEKVVVEVSASGLSFSQAIAKAEFDNGTTSATFTGIPEGAATVTMKAYNATNQLIGQASENTSVTAGATTTVDIQLQLDPTYSQPSSGGSSSTGSITAIGTIIDGASIEAVQLQEKPAALVTDQLGRVWVGTNDTTSRVARIELDGTISLETPVPEPVIGLALWGEEVLVVGQPNFPLEYSLTELPGSLVELGWSTFPTVNGESFFPLAKMTRQGGYMFPGAHDAEWTKVGKGERSFNGNPEGFPLLVSHDLVEDPSGQLWEIGYTFANGATDPPTPGGLPFLARNSADGTPLEAYPLPLAAAPGALAIDGSSYIWVTDTAANTVLKVSPEGTVLGTFTTGANPKCITIDDASGDVWIGNYDDGTVTRLSSAGQLIDTYVVGTGPVAIVVASTGAWVANEGSRNVVRLAP